MASAGAPFERLAQERVVVSARLELLEAQMAELFAASRDDNSDDEHDPEGQTIAYERSQLAAMIRQARDHLQEIDLATVRVTAGTYGSCEVCGRSMAEERLAARPTVRTCVLDAALRA